MVAAVDDPPAHAPRSVTLRAHMYIGRIESESQHGDVRGYGEKREKGVGGDKLSLAPIKDRQVVDGGDQRLRETVGDCEPDRLESERENYWLLSQVVFFRVRQ
jgi:hypothetical protein